MSAPLRIAAAQYDITELRDWDDYVGKVTRWIELAASNKAQLLVFPEYASMELVSLLPPHIRADLPAQLEALQQYLPSFLRLYRQLALGHRVYIVAPSFPLLMADNVFNNVAYLFSPDGTMASQAKLNMTRFESERWGITAADKIQVFNTPLGKFAINVCYDAEFPRQAHEQAMLGARFIIVPSCTDTLAGYYRVRIGCQARALENQCYVIQAATVGNAPWSDAVDINIGAAGVFSPADCGFPDNGIVALGELNHACWLYADLDFDKIDAVRNNGQVLNFRDGGRRVEATTAIVDI